MFPSYPCALAIVHPLFLDRATLPSFLCTLPDMWDCGMKQGFSAAGLPQYVVKPNTNTLQKHIQANHI